MANTTSSRLIFLVPLLFSSPGQAATYTVTSTNDSGNGTLRQAIQDANSSGGLDSIDFNIPGSGPHTISLTAKLDDITSPVVIDGTTEPDYVDEPVIYLDGSSAGVVDGLHLGAGSGGSTIRGLAIGEFGVTGIDIRSDGNTIEGNYIGTDVTGTLRRGNWEGLYVDGNDNVIGGLTTGAGNVIGDNANEGIEIRGDRTVVQGNHIGTDPGDSIDLGNEAYGVLIWQTATDSTIGGTASGAGNSIAFNSWDGITLLSNVTGHSILRNTFFANGEIAIDLNDDQVTGNDAGDGDGGENNSQNFPLLSSAATSGSLITIDGTLNSTSNTDFRIEFFASEVQDPTTNGEGERYLGTVDVTTNGSGNATINVILAASVTAGEYISSTATVDSGGGGFGDTSEFSDNVVAVAAPASDEISGRVFEDADFAGTASGWDGGTGDAAMPNVDVELYDAADSYISSTTTDANGLYILPVPADGTYKVRVRSATIGDADTPPDAGLNATVPATWPYPLAEMTWGEGAAMYGGQSATVNDADTVDNGGPGDTWVSVTVSGSNVTDVNFGFSYDLVMNTLDDSGADNARSTQGSLRQFLKNSNGIADTRTSWIRIPNTDPNYNGTGVGEYTITPVAAFPTIVDTVVLNGASHPDFIDRPLIEIDGSSVADGSGGLILVAGSDGSTIRGFVINRFSGAGSDDDGIRIESDNNLIAGNYIGTDVIGMVALANGTDGIQILDGASGNTIGGTTELDRNVVSGNSGLGIAFTGAGTTGNLVQGNYVGVASNGSSLLGNGIHGIRVTNGAQATIGGTADGADNIIAGNGQVGIRIHNSATVGTSIIRNSIYANTGLGIDLTPVGVNANDPDDADSGVNDLLNFPVITLAGDSGGTVSVDFDLDVPAGDYRIEFFTNPSGADPLGYGEGEAFADTLTITHTGSGVESFSHSFTGAAGDILTSTVTEESAGPVYGSTSEFSAAVTVTNSLGIVKRAFWSDGTPIPTGATIPGGVAFKYLLYVNNPGAARLDVTVRDVLDPAFQYQAGTIQVDNSVGQCAAPACTALEEQAIFAAADSATVLTDAADVDVASYTGAGTSIDAGDGNVGNLQLDINGNAVWTILFSVKML